MDIVTDTGEPLLVDVSTEKDVLDDKKEAETTTDDDNRAKSQFLEGAAPIIDDVIQKTLIVDNFIENNSEPQTISNDEPKDNINKSRYIHDVDGYIPPADNVVVETSATNKQLSDCDTTKNAIAIEQQEEGIIQSTLSGSY
jgi:hypothetical protein